MSGCFSGYRYLFVCFTRVHLYILYIHCPSPPLSVPLSLYASQELPFDWSEKSVPSLSRLTRLRSLFLDTGLFLKSLPQNSLDLVLASLVNLKVRKPIFYHRTFRVKKKQGPVVVVARIKET